MGIYYFHIRDEFGLIEDHDGIELPDGTALLLEVIQSADEFVSEAATVSKMRFEVTDAEGQTVLIAPVREGAEIWNLLARLSTASGGIH